MRRAGTLGLVVLVAACGRGPERASAAGPSSGGPPRTPASADAGAASAGGKPGAPAAEPAVVLRPATGDPVRVRVEVMRTEEERRRGMMYRQNLAADAGMLFLFPEDEIHAFWMKNTLIPLDMIFIRADGTVAGVVENAEPKTLTGRSIDAPARHVLEVNGGFARAHGIAAGTKVQFEHVEMTGIDP